MYSKKDLILQMQQMGLRADDTVLIHTSMRAVGAVEGGADSLLDAFCEYLCRGLFLVPTHTWMSVNAENPVYDVRTSVSCIGIVPVRAAARQDGFRSLHPTHSMWGFGADAETFLQGEENAHSPCPPGFCWDRLADRGAKLLLIGVGHDRDTFLHSVDERAGLTDRLGDPFAVTIIDRNGNRLESHICGHSCSKAEDVADCYVNFDEPFLRTGVQTLGKLGDAVVRIVDAAAAQALVLKIYARGEEEMFLRYGTIPEELYR